VCSGGLLLRFAWVGAQRRVGRGAALRHLQAEIQLRQLPNIGETDAACSSGSQLTLGGDDLARDRAGEADGEVADVDELLHLANALGADLAHLEGDQVAEGLALGAQRLADLAHDLAAAGGRHLRGGENEGMAGEIL